MLSIRDERVRTLAERVMQNTGAPTVTAAIRLALENEVARHREEESLGERIAKLRREALAKAIRPPQPPLTKEERDALWER